MRIHRQSNVQSSLPTAHAPKSASRQTSGNTLQQIQRYLDMEDIETDCSAFWHKSQTSLDKLYLPAMRALSVPASSAAVERVFSQGGLNLRPHRARLSDTQHDRSRGEGGAGDRDGREGKGREGRGGKRKGRGNYQNFWTSSYGVIRRLFFCRFPLGKSCHCRRLPKILTTESKINSTKLCHKLTTNFSEM